MRKLFIALLLYSAGLTAQTFNFTCAPSLEIEGTPAIERVEGTNSYESYITLNQLVQVKAIITPADTNILSIEAIRLFENGNRSEIYHWITGGDTVNFYPNNNDRIYIVVRTGTEDNSISIGSHTFRYKVQ